jgi:glycosyltransferase involved in cell wall biosynthesis
MPEVSVIMGVCNGGPFFAATVASVRAQTFTDWELVVVINGATDNSADTVLAAQADPRIRVIRHPEALGPGGALNLAGAEARGRYLAVLDYDDVAAPRRLEMQLAYFALRPGLLLLGARSELIDTEGRFLGYEPFVGVHEDIRGLTPYVHALRHSTVMFPCELLEKFPYRASLGVSSDRDLFARVSEAGLVEAMPVSLCQYRLHPANVSRQSVRTALSRGLVSMLTLRRRRGLPEEFEAWERRFFGGVAANDGAGRAYAHCARIFFTQGEDDMAAFYAWLAMREGAGMAAAWTYLRATLRGLGRSRAVTKATLRAWCKEPAHQLLLAGGVSDRPQF